MGRSSNYATEKRTQILEYLKENTDRDVTVKDIEVYLTEEKGISVNVTTIYRYLDKLSEEGLVLKRVDKNGNKSSFQYIEPKADCHSHLHLKCRGCGIIYHMDCDFMREFQEHIYEHHQFALECRTSMLYGLCKKCSSDGLITM